jgi:hypothetical protein
MPSHEWRDEAPLLGLNCLALLSSSSRKVARYPARRTPDRCSRASAQAGDAGAGRSATVRPSFRRLAARRVAHSGVLHAEQTNASVGFTVAVAANSLRRRLPTRGPALLHGIPSSESRAQTGRSPFRGAGAIQPEVKVRPPSHGPNT